jgi:hypothetical protein
VEEAAIRYVKCHYKTRGWSVQNVSSKNLGYDLLCKSFDEERHVEVKGARGDGQQFIITRKELKAWTTDSRFVLAFVANALSTKPSLASFPKAGMQKEFSFDALCFMAKRKPNFSWSGRATSARRSSR